MTYYVWNERNKKAPDACQWQAFIEGWSTKQIMDRLGYRKSTAEKIRTGKTANLKRLRARSVTRFEEWGSDRHDFGGHREKFVGGSQCSVKK